MQNQPAVQQGKGAALESPQGEQIAQFEAMAENSPQAGKQAQLAAMVDASPAMAVQRKLLGQMHNSPVLVAQRKAINGIAQRAEGAAKPNNTGLPDNLKSGIESLSGMAMDNVKVHYNSSQPAQLNALAYAQGTDIHVAPGQEQHLPHEAWHVVQQAQGRVRPTMQMKGGVPVNDDAGLEREADVMGGKAVQMRWPLETQYTSIQAPSNGVSIQIKGDVNKVAQMVLATVNPQNGPVGLQQAGGGGAFVVMQNPTQPNGDDVNNTVGFTGVLNAADWADLGKSPADYWRAHAYANSFGGAGDVTNVGWWKADSETRWTDYEQKVRGAGLAQIPAWLPGTGETGTYMVERTMHPAVLLKNRYVTDLMKAVSWGLDDGSAAWLRALATCDTIFPLKDRQKRIAALNQMKTDIAAAANGRIQAWVDNLFGTSPLETNLIKSMKMTYAITLAGLNAGASRQGFSKTVSSEKPNPMSFGLKDEPENIWVQLVNSNVGVFAQGNSPVALMVGRVPYDDPWKPAQVLRAYADGWGV